MSENKRDDSRSTGISQRRVRNFLLQPGVQLQMGIYALGVAFVISIAMVAVFYVTYARILDLLLELTDFRSEVTAIIWDYTIGAGFWIGLLMLLFVALNFTMSVIITHRLVGPTVAFRRHIDQLCLGNYKSRVSLRDSDAFTEVAHDLNRLAGKLEKQYQGKPRSED